MSTRCPLCQSGTLSSTQRHLSYRGTTLTSDAYLCSACREVVLDSAQVEALRAAIRQQGLAETDEQVDGVIQRAMLQGL